MSYKVPRGTSDLLTPEIQLRERIFQGSRTIFNIFGFKEIATPIFEDSRLFLRSLGQTSDIVTKQLLNIETKEKPLCLRPEGTASVIRAFLEQHFDKKEAFKKFFYIGPMFRGERPQKGRLRQFTHIGAEAIGSYHPALDAEIILLMTRLLDSIPVSNYVIILNSVGCAKDKEKLKDLLKKALKGKAASLCQDCRNRLSRNVLRILDCKKDSCKEIVAKLSFFNEFRCQDCTGHFNKVKEFLSTQQVKFRESPCLVRGLDYYTGTVFEVTHSELGSQDALGAGGRYDNLVAQLGGPDMGAVGFALGLERIILSLDDQEKAREELKSKALEAFVVITQDDFFPQGSSILNTLRNNGISADMDYTNRSLKAQMRRANSVGAKFVIVLGEEEDKANRVSIKDMQSGKQDSFARKDMVSKIKELLKGNSV